MAEQGQPQNEKKRVGLLHQPKQRYDNNKEASSEEKASVPRGGVKTNIWCAVGIPNEGERQLEGQEEHLAHDQNSWRTGTSTRMTPAATRKVTQS